MVSGYTVSNAKHEHTMTKHKYNATTHACFNQTGHAQTIYL